MPPPVPPIVKLGRKHARQADRLDELDGFGQRVGDADAGNIEADLQHRVLELRAVLGLVDHFGPGADHLDAEFLQHAVPVQSPSRC